MDCDALGSETFDAHGCLLYVGDIPAAGIAQSGNLVDIYA